MPIFPTNKPVLVITTGDPGGIGPEITARSLNEVDIAEAANYIVIGDESSFYRFLPPGVRDRTVRCDVNFSQGTDTSGKNNVFFIDPSAGGGTAGKYEKDIENSQKAINALNMAVKITGELGSKGTAPVIVTAPVNKKNVSEIIPGFTGHTEFFKEAFSSPFVSMVFIGRTLRTVPVTRHIPLKDVASTITTKMITRTVEQVIDNRFLITGKNDPMIGIAALNPHAGESGAIGREEGQIIIPAVRVLKKRYDKLAGPLPADVAFRKAYTGGIDIVIGMYHDQCLGPFKMLDFDSGVNLTIGLDYFRTSPDHGTAYDIAGKGIADTDSMEEAIRLAIRAASCRE